MFSLNPSLLRGKSRAVDVLPNGLGWSFLSSLRLPLFLFWCCPFTFVGETLFIQLYLSNKELWGSFWRKLFHWGYRCRVCRRRQVQDLTCCHLEPNLSFLHFLMQFSICCLAPSVGHIPCCVLELSGQLLNILMSRMYPRQIRVPGWWNSGIHVILKASQAILKYIWSVHDSFLVFLESSVKLI